MNQNLPAPAVHERPPKDETDSLDDFFKAFPNAESQSIPSNSLTPSSSSKELKSMIDAPNRSGSESSHSFKVMSHSHSGKTSTDGDKAVDDQADQNSLSGGASEERKEEPMAASSQETTESREVSSPSSSLTEPALLKDHKVQDDTPSFAPDQSSELVSNLTPERPSDFNVEESLPHRVWESGQSGENKIEVTSVLNLKSLSQGLFGQLPGGAANVRYQADGQDEEVVEELNLATTSGKCTPLSGTPSLKLSPETDQANTCSLVKMATRSPTPEKDSFSYSSSKQFFLSEDLSLRSSELGQQRKSHFEPPCAKPDQKLKDDDLDAISFEMVHDKKCPIGIKLAILTVLATCAICISYFTSYLGAKSILAEETLASLVLHYEQEITELREQNNAQAAALAASSKTLREMEKEVNSMAYLLYSCLAS